MADETIRQYYEQNRDAPTPYQGQVNNDVRIRHEVIKASVGKKS